MQQHTRQAFLAAYEEHADAIYRHCFFRVYSVERAQELMQETFVKTWEYLAAGNPVDNLKPFLYRVATNLIIDGVRRKKEQNLDDLMAAHVLDEPSHRGDLDMEQRALIRQVRDLIDQLPEADRELIRMRYLDDLDPKDIAVILKITPNHVSVRLNRAIAKLRALVTPHTNA